MLEFEEGVDLLIHRGVPYHREGYFFLEAVLDFTLKQAQKRRKTTATSHVTTEELLEGFRKKALKEFGPMAKTLLSYWGIQGCSDIGKMIFQLIEVGVLAKSQQDEIASFEGCFSFEEAFVNPFLPKKSGS
jgi:uncharacterized repeat protein (TIGR04138 family)